MSCESRLELDMEINVINRCQGGNAVNADRCFGSGERLLADACGEIGAAGPRLVMRFWILLIQRSRSARTMMGQQVHFSAATHKPASDAARNVAVTISIWPVTTVIYQCVVRMQASPDLGSAR